MKRILLSCMVLASMLLGSCTRQGTIMTPEELSQALEIKAPTPPINSCLLVGINKYPSAPLNGCVNDVYNMKKFLIENGYFKENEICTLIDEQAQKRVIKLALLNIKERSTRGSKVYFGFSGHGTQVPGENGSSEIDGFYEVVCPVDFEWDENGNAQNAITDKEFVEIFRQLPAGVIFNWSSDSCHSGDLTREVAPLSLIGKMKAKIKSFPIPAKVAAKLRLARAENPKSKGMVNGVLDVGFLSGCRSDQTSADAFFLQSEGAFTHFFIQAMKREPNATLKQLEGMMQRDMKLAGFEQRPQAEGARVKKRFLKD
jgi:metacaspase-1